MKFKFPSFNQVFIYSLLSVVITVVFSIIYFQANDFAAKSKLFELYLGWEKQIPFIPSFIIVYFSLNVLMTMPIFYFDKRKIIRFAITLIVGTLIAGLIFVLLPGKLAYERVIPEGIFEGVYKKLFEMDKPHNLAPSLHIFYSYTTIFYLIDTSKKKLWHLWGVLMCFSVLFTHQHHLLDIALGLILSFGLFKIIIQK